MALNISGGLPKTDDRPKWLGPTTEGTILGWIKNNQFFTQRYAHACGQRDRSAA